VGGDQLNDADPVPPEGAAEATIAKAGRDTLALPSLTEITMPLLVPAAVGVPESRPLDVLKAAHEGLFAMLKVRGSLFASLAVGVKL